MQVEKSIPNTTAQQLNSAVVLARHLLECDERTRYSRIHDMQQTRTLSRCVQGLNKLLDSAEHRGLAKQALESIGFADS